jgi:hypothetical protein
VGSETKLSLVWMQLSGKKFEVQQAPTLSSRKEIWCHGSQFCASRGALYGLSQIDVAKRHGLNVLGNSVRRRRWGLRIRKACSSRIKCLIRIGHERHPYKLEHKKTGTYLAYSEVETQNTGPQQEIQTS